jgi:high-affinity iron transporter
MSGKKISAVFWSLALVAALTGPASAPAEDRAGYGSWGEIAEAMEASLNKAYEAYFQKDAEQGKQWVNDAYFGYYEKEGFERTVLAYISGKRGAKVEYQFSIIKKMMTEGRPKQEVRGAVDDLVKWLREDARRLDGQEESGLSVFLASLAIILREGLEAILVIAAIAAYLTRSGNAAKTKVVYQGAAAAVAASVLTAVVLRRLISGADQEIMEGSAMLLAAVVLFFVSNWMFSKSEAEAWKSYIEGKVRSSVVRGSTFALGAAAFLAVFREGAETILFYQAMLADVRRHIHMIWLGLGAGSLGLAAAFIIIRYGSLRLPLKQFFVGTGSLMYLMAIAFAGGGIKELQEGDVIGVTPVDFVTSIDI